MLLREVVDAVDGRRRVDGGDVHVVGHAVEQPSDGMLHVVLLAVERRLDELLVQVGLDDQRRRALVRVRVET